MSEEESKLRKYARHKGAKRAFVLVPDSNDALPLHIVDISKGGLSYRYLGQNGVRTTKIDLYYESELIAEDIPVNSVSDERIPNNLLPLSRGSLRFGELSTEQETQLERFIEAFTEQNHEKE